MSETLYKVTMPVFSAAIGGFAIRRALTGDVDGASLEAAFSIACELISINGSIYDSKK